MSLLEFLGEQVDPGGTGGVQVGGRGPRRPDPALLVLRLVVSAAALGGAYYLLFQRWTLTLEHVGIAAGVTALYLVAGYALRPEPDTSNMGWLGGLIDNPFRYSGDINRFLLFLAVVLLPGRFVAEALVDGFLLLGRR